MAVFCLVAAGCGSEPDVAATSTPALSEPEGTAGASVAPAAESATPEPATPEPDPTPASAAAPTPVPQPTSDPSPSASDACYVGQGPADEPAWICGQRVCDPLAPHAGCPSEAPPHAVDVSVACVIEGGPRVAVDEVLTYRSIVTPPGLPVDLAFDHGDGTIDPRPISQAFYAEPGSYVVELQWNHAGGSGVSPCGTVEVHDGLACDLAPGCDINCGPTLPTQCPDVSAYIGLELSEVETMAGQGARIVRIDSEWFAVTQDYVADRLNFEIDNGFVSKVTLG